MSNYNYNIAVRRAKTCIKYVHKEYRIAVNPVWSYYWAKQILKPRTLVPKLKVAKSKSTGNHISRQVYKKDYIDMAQRLISYVEREHKLPNFIKVELGGKEYKVRRDDYVYMFARILNYQYENGRLPSYANVNSKAFTKPTEYHNDVYDYFIQVFGKFGDTIDGALNKIAGNGYGYYYDDVYSNRTSIDRMHNGQGVNCTDSCQVFYNIIEALIHKGKYRKVECLHVLCSGGDGHVRLRITMNDSSYIYRDPAAVLSSGDITYNWCSDGELLAVNPSWFMENLNK